MRKCILSLLLCAATVFFPGRMMSQTFWDGTTDEEWAGEGTSTSPYLITSAAELAGLAKRTNKGETFEGKYIQLAADIWLSDESMPADERPLWTPIGLYSLNNDDEETNPGGFYGTEYWFKGNFDGGGHTIYNLWYTGTTDFDDWNDPFGSGQLDFSAWYKALFGLLDGATVSNLKLENVNVGGTALIGGLSIRVKNSTFTDISVSGSIKSGDLAAGGSAGAIAVEAYNSHFKRCSTSAKVYARSNTGGLVGHLYGASTVDECSSTGEVTGGVHIGGLIGVSSLEEGEENGPTPMITNSTSSAVVNIIPARNQGDMGAGFIGYNEGTISCCSATGDVNVLSDTGAGFCYANYGTIESCYATGNVHGTENIAVVCSFIGDNGIDEGYGDYRPGTILNCYGAGKLSGDNNPRISGFGWINLQYGGSVMANCYYDATKNPELYGDGNSIIGSYGVTTEYLQSRQFVDELNFMAAVMGTNLWEYVEGGYPVPTDVKATSVEPFFAGGKGTAESPYLISNKKQLENLAFAANRNWNFIGQYFLQTADIALNEPKETWGDKMPEQWTPIAVYNYATEGDRLSHRFCGVYDGGLHTVSNLYIDNDALLCAGLFGIIGKDAVIKNLGVTDVWMAAKDYVAPIVGSVRVQNECDQFNGNVSLIRCWSSGELTMGRSGGVIGDSNTGGMTYIDACYSTVDSNTSALVGASYYQATELNGCWFGGKVGSTSVAFSANEILFWSFADKDRINNLYNRNQPYLRSTEYMQSRQFVNDLNYAAAYKGIDGGWCYNEGSYPAFSGEAPALTVKLDDGIGGEVSFKAFKGSVLSKPSDPQREGYRMLGWYEDAEFTRPFAFGSTELTSDLTLYARWGENIEPDYSIFGNKFAKTFTITTPAQLYAFANIVSGTAPDTDRSDFEGKTVVLGNDIELNDIADYEFWGNGITPLEFPGIGSYNYSYGFNGSFDGQGHAIVGLYSGNSLFAVIQEKGSVKNLVLKNAYIANQEGYSNALFAQDLFGSLYQCGAEGKIEGTQSKGSTNTYLAGLIREVKSSGSVEQCYADVEISCDQNGIAGLVGVNGGSVKDSYSIGNVLIINPGNFGGVIGLNSGSVSGCYSALSLDWEKAPENINGSYGGLYGYNSDSEAPKGYFNKELVEAAFKMFPSAWSGNFYESSMAKGTGLTTAEMKRMDSYLGWDFTNVWGRRSDMNDGYPYLRWTAPGLPNDIDGSGVESVDIDNSGEVVIYDLQGYPVYKGTDGGFNLPSGIYLKRCGGKTTKIVVR
ncbi:MAG: InlB B-repeat-containing protein [Muribaculaceae bacterium]|nr:InlB B-repeat-containing protein [Muribaculaceae bacterium]